MRVVGATSVEEPTSGVVNPRETPVLDVTLVETQGSWNVPRTEDQEGSVLTTVSGRPCV